jgi:hypothetical protein
VNPCVPLVTLFASAERASKRKLLCESWSSHSSVARDSSLLEYDAVSVEPVFSTFVQLTRTIYDGVSFHDEVEYIKATFRENTHLETDTSSSRSHSCRKPRRPVTTLTECHPCTILKIATEHDIQPPFVQLRMTLNWRPRVYSILCGECGQVCVGQTGCPLRPWRDNCHTWLSQFGGSLCNHRFNHDYPNPGRQKPLHQTPLRGPAHLFKTARLFFFFGLLDPKDKVPIIFRNAGNYSPNDTGSYSTRLESSGNC